MSFQLLSRKVSAVREALNDWQLQSLERSFAETSKSLLPGHHGSAAGRGYLFIEILYAILRHREWLEVPVFRAIAVEFLQLDHGLPHKAAGTVVDTLIAESSRLGVLKERTLCVDDREFLNYCYVSAASAANDIELEIELGLGTAMIRKLRDGVRVLEDARTDIFIPEYDAMLASIVVELGHQTKVRPWALDEHRLKYKLLCELGDAAVPWVYEENLPSLLQALLQVGKREFVWTESPELCETLEKAKLIIPDRDGRGRIRGWDLTTDGASLTASLYKHQFGLDTIQKMDLFLTLTLTWQIAILRDASVSSLDFVMELLSQHLTRLAPTAIETAVARVVALGDRVLEPETVKSLLGAAKLPWHKAAVMRALVEVAPSDELASVIAESLSGDTTTSMMEAAGALLDRWGHMNNSVEG